MTCGCKARSTEQYVWTSADGTSTVIYTSEIAAKAKVMRKGGSYTLKEG